MFIIKSEKDKSITWPVKVEVAADGGKIKKYEFTGVFRRLDDDEKEAIDDELKSADASSGDEGGNVWKVRNVDAIMRIMADWKGVADQDKNPIEFTRDNLLAAARSINGTPILRAINIAISEISTGALTKN
jgi:hypothetical protein